MLIYLLMSTSIATAHGNKPVTTPKQSAAVPEIKEAAAVPETKEATARTHPTISDQDLVLINKFLLQLIMIDMLFKDKKDRDFQNNRRKTLVNDLGLPDVVKSALITTASNILIDNNSIVKTFNVHGVPEVLVATKSGDGYWTLQLDLTEQLKKGTKLTVENIDKYLRTHPINEGWD